MVIDVRENLSVNYFFFFFVSLQKQPVDSMCRPATYNNANAMKKCCRKDEHSLLKFLALVSESILNIILIRVFTLENIVTLANSYKIVLNIDFSHFSKKLGKLFSELRRNLEFDSNSKLRMLGFRFSNFEKFEVTFRTFQLDTKKKKLIGSKI